MKLTDNELKILLKFVYCEVAYTKREKTIHPSYKASLARLKKKLEDEILLGRKKKLNQIKSFK